MTDDRIDRLERLTRLRDQGVLSSDEFEAEKARVLGSASENGTLTDFQPSQKNSAVAISRDQNIWLYVSLGLLALIALLAIVFLMPLNAAPPPQEPYLSAVEATQLTEPGSLDPLPELAPVATPVAVGSGPMPPKITQEWRSLRTRIREGWETEPMLANRYVIIRLGCGTGCSSNIVGDHRTGNIYDLGLGGEAYDQLQLKFGSSSDLITARWGDIEAGMCVTQRYRWTGTQLQETSAREIIPRVDFGCEEMAT